MEGLHRPLRFAGHADKSHARLLHSSANGPGIFPITLIRRHPQPDVLWHNQPHSGLQLLQLGSTKVCAAKKRPCRRAQAGDSQTTAASFSKTVRGVPPCLPRQLPRIPQTRSFARSAPIRLPFLLTLPLCCTLVGRSSSLAHGDAGLKGKGHTIILRHSEGSVMMVPVPSQRSFVPQA